MANLYVTRSRLCWTGKISAFKKQLEIWAGQYDLVIELIENKLH